MESENSSVNHQSDAARRLVSAVVPVLFIAVSYIDPGKWAAAVEGGARFGHDLVMLMLAFNLAAMFCQYICARVAVVTGRDLAQICSEEYDRVTCLFLGIQAEVSMIALDLTMVLGTAHGLNTVFGIDLFTSVFLTAVNAVLYPVLASLLDNGKAKILCISWASLIFVSYVFGVLISQPENTLPLGGILTRLSGESAFALMSLLGANLMPHNFYLHSSIVQQDQRPMEVSKKVLAHDHFFAIFCTFSGISLVNYVLMSSAAYVFYSAGLVLLTFQDALSLLDQLFGSPIAPVALVLVMSLSSQVTALSWDLGGQAVLHNLFRVEIPGWLHYATIRIIAVIPALYCVWSSGAEGVYQLLIYVQVIVALVLPSSVIPLFRVASSKTIMGSHKISHVLEFLALGTFIGMLGLKLIFIIEMIFGNSDWVSNLKWNVGSNVSIPYAILVIAASVSLCLMLWLAATPLKSASTRLDAQVLNWEMHTSLPERHAEGEDIYGNESLYIDTRPWRKQVPTVSEVPLESQSDLPPPGSDLNLPETLLDPLSSPYLSTIEENKSETSYTSPSETDTCTSVKRMPDIDVSTKVSLGECTNISSRNSDSVDVEEKTLRVEGDVPNEKDDEGESLDPEELTKEVSESFHSLATGGSGSFKSPSGKSDDLGSGTGSLSRLAGLGRAARRQLTGILDEFWGQLFGFHGQATQEAKMKKLDLLLGVDSKLDSRASPVAHMVENSRKEFSTYLPCTGARCSESMMHLNLSSKQQLGIDDETPYAVQRGVPSLWATRTHLLDAYVRHPGHSILDSGERRYSSMRIPASSAGYDQQPATFHGYELASYLNRVAKERDSQYLNGQMEPLVPKSTSSVATPYVDPYSRGSGQKPRNGWSNKTPPGFPSLSVIKNSSVQSGNNVNDLGSPDGMGDSVNATNAKKFYSLPDISGLSVPYRDSSISEKNVVWDNSMAYGQTGGRLYDQTCPSSSPRTEVPVGFNELSPSKVCRDAFSLQFTSSTETGSLWSRQPYEQFGVAEKTRAAVTRQVGSMETAHSQEAASIVDLEAKLLQSFRSCIVKLLKLEGSDWLFRQNDGADEDLIDRVAARERFLIEVEARDINRSPNAGESQFSERKLGIGLRTDEAEFTVPNCGEGCVWQVGLVISFGVWCIHRILELSLMESRPELWGKYTYVLNRLQGIIDPAFFKPRSPMTPCFCLQIPVGQQQRLSSPISNGSLPPPAKLGRGKCTTAAMLLDIIKDVEIAISCRKGRTGTAAGDVAFPKGKENLASVLKRYKRRLSNKTIGSQEGGSGPRKTLSSNLYGL